MSQLANPPKSPTLAPPRKSVELEDPGAHELGMAGFPAGLWNLSPLEDSDRMQIHQAPKMMSIQTLKKVKPHFRDPAPQYL